MYHVPARLAPIQLAVGEVCKKATRAMRHYVTYFLVMSYPLQARGLSGNVAS